MSLKRRYSCIYIPHETNNMLYFELTLHNKDLNNIVLQINKEFNLDFKIDNSYIDDNYGILLLNKTNNLNLNMDNKVNGNILFITHFANLDEYVKSNENLKNKTNLDQILSLCMNFVTVKKLFESC